MAEERRWTWPLVLAGIYAAFTAIALLAWWLVDDAWWNQLINMTTMWWTLPAILLLVIALIRRSWVVSALLAVPIAVLVWSYATLYVGSAPADEGDLRIASWNILITTPDVSHVVSLVERERPDVLLVQEVSSTRARELEDELGDRLPNAWFGDRDFVGGVGLLSRYPIVEVREIPGSESFERPTSVVVLEVPDGEATRRIQVVPMHLISACPICGSFIDRQRREVELRRTEIAAVIGALDRDVPAIVGGDLNGNQRSTTYRALADAGFRDPQVETGWGPGLTYPTQNAEPFRGPPPSASGQDLPTLPLAHIPLIRAPILRLDWVLARDLVPVAAAVPQGEASDHRPVVVDLAWPERASGE